MKITKKYYKRAFISSKGAGSIPQNPSKILVILGPTASGKSDLAVDLALRLSSGYAKKSGIKGGEIISADSRQVYKGLDLGSGKVPKDKSKVDCQKSKASNDFYYKGIKHHLIDVASPKKVFTVSQFQKLGERAIKKITKQNKLPIICGGTGLYIDSLIYEKQFPEVPPQPKLRKKLEKLSTENLFEKLKKLDPQRAKNIDRHNRRRLVRALEIVITTGKPVPQLPRHSAPSNPRHSAYLFIGIKKSPEKLKELITKRLYKRLKQGMIKEVEDLRHPPAGGKGLSWKRLDDLGLEYRYISRYLQEVEMIKKNKRISVNLRNNLRKSASKEMENLIIKESVNYAKRQMTWFKRNESIKWINPHTKKGSVTVFRLCEKFLKSN